MVHEDDFSTLGDDDALREVVCDEQPFHDQRCHRCANLEPWALCIRSNVFVHANFSVCLLTNEVLITRTQQFCRIYRELCSFMLTNSRI